MVPAPPRSTTCSSGAAALAVHDWGGSGPPVLLAHPTGFHGRIWAPVASRLVGAGRRVFSFDFRGHGDSEAPDGDYHWSGFAHDVLAVVDHLGLAGVADLLAAGHSKGGAALLLAEAERPGTLRHIWAYEPIVIPTDHPLPPQEDMYLARAARRRRNEWASPEEAFEAFAGKPPLNVMTAESLRAYVEYGLRDRGDGVFELKCRPEVEARVYAMSPTHDCYARLPGVQSRVVVVCGEHSADISPGFGQRIAERLPHGRVEVMHGCGHFGPQQDPDGAVASMLAFAAEQTSA